MTAPAASTAPPRRRSLRRRLLVAILLPVVAVIAAGTAGLHAQALAAADVAYDRTLLASAKSIGEWLDIAGEGADMRLTASVPYSAIEAFEADNRSRLYFKVSGFAGELVAGFDDLPAWHGSIPMKTAYAALVDFYDARFRGDRVRMVVLLQPVAAHGGHGMATIQVAETLELRRTLARQILVATLWRQVVLVAVIALVVAAGVQWATQPVHDLSATLRRRGATDLSPIDADAAPRELAPLIDATNQVMARLAAVLAHQKRFVRDTSHQLRTPLAVLKAQVQSALRGDVAPSLALAEINATVERATALANQMLALAKVEQLRQQDDAPRLDWAEIVRGVALDVAPLAAERHLDFEVDAAPAAVRGHEWALRELVRNLLHNAVRHSPRGAPLAVRLAVDAGWAVLTIADRGPGLAAGQRQRLFQPFAPGPAPDDGPAAGGSGLGLAICDEIVRSLGGTLSLDNRVDDSRRVLGLDATARLPLADNRA